MSSHHRKSRDKKKESSHDVCSPCCNPNPGCPAPREAVEYFHLQGNPPYPEPDAHSDETSHSIWRSRYKIWNRNTCPCRKGYFCRPHGLWVPGYEVHSKAIRERDEFGYSNCPSHHLYPEPQESSEAGEGSLHRDFDQLDMGGDDAYRRAHYDEDADSRGERGQRGESSYNPYEASQDEGSSYRGTAPIPIQSSRRHKGSSKTSSRGKQREVDEPKSYSEPPETQAYVEQGYDSHRFQASPTPYVEQDYDTHRYQASPTYADESLDREPAPFSSKDRRPSRSQRQASSRSTRSEKGTKSYSDPSEEQTYDDQNYSTPTYGASPIFADEGFERGPAASTSRDRHSSRSQRQGSSRSTGPEKASRSSYYYDEEHGYR